MLERQQATLEGMVELSCEPIDAQAYQLTLRVMNFTPFTDTEGKGTEDQAVLLRTFASAHVILTAQAGEFISLLDPSNSYAEAAATCHNQGMFPVLVGSKAPIEVSSRRLIR